MTSKEEWKKQWEESEPIERRARLNELAARGYDTLDDDGQREHDQLATMVAEDEDAAEAEARNGSE
jgi:hypothetical protein